MLMLIFLIFLLILSVFSLNTSHVNVNHLTPHIELPLLQRLNTSHVNVNRKDVER